jgi:hypothetical protein
MLLLIDQNNLHLIASFFIKRVEKLEVTICSTNENSPLIDADPRSMEWIQ